MSGLYLHTSNRLEILAERLAALTLEEPLPPLTSEAVVVQSRGMARWLTLRVAAHCGICAHFDFPFPNLFLTELFRQVLPAGAEATEEQELLIWLVMELLPGLGEQPDGVALREYLGAGPDLKQYQLARELARLFDQYLIYRPDLVRGWEEGRGQGWQPELWRRLAVGLGGPHRARLQEQALQALLQPAGSVGLTLPPRVSIFGISSLPPYHLQLFAALARHRAVHFFVLNPCEEYWADIVSDREIARLSRRQPGPAPLLHLDRGNRLLASMGRQGRDFLTQLCELEGREEQLFSPPAGGHLLAAVQADILELRDRDRRAGRQEADPADGSIEIHSCHSPMREVEVLKDHLLALFDRQPELEPRDILVMAPDIELYAPLIQAVFEAGPEEPQRIPYSIADRSPRREGRIFETFLALLELSSSRFGVTRVLRLLEEPAVRRRFGLSENDLPLLEEWLRAAAVRWGIDATHRAGLGLPAAPEHTWRFGLDRLLLGTALAGTPENLVHGILPCDLWEGQGTILGRFLDFMEALCRWVPGLTGKKKLAGWSERLLHLLEVFFESEEEWRQELQQMREALLALARHGSRSPRLEVDLEVLRVHLQAAFERVESPFGFLTGGVTFCALLPMRAIPAPVVCLLGMNDADYPRSAPRSGLDLMAEEVRPGDRSRRQDDRYLFLEALVSARHQLYISYVGQSIRDGSEQPPSVLVNELLDYLEEGFVFPAGQEIRTRLVTNHRLQPFAPAYFEPEGRLFSYSREQWQAAAALEAEKVRSRPLLSTPLPEPPRTEVRLEDLCRFLAHPVRFFCEQRLELFLEQEQEPLEDREPFELAGLERYQLTTELVEQELAGQAAAAGLELCRAGGRLPPGNLGEAAYETLCREVRAFSRRVAPLVRVAPLEPLTVDLELGGWRLTGRLAEIRPAGLLRFRCAALKAQDHLRYWPTHLLLNLLQPAGYPREGLLLGPEGGYRYLEVANSDELLTGLLELYGRGLTGPLPLFPRAAAAYAETLRQGKSEPEARLRAGRVWRNAGFAGPPGEGLDGYHRLCFREADPLDDHFRRLALEVFGPLLAHRQKEA